MGNELPSINLARGKQKSFLDKFLDWALTFGRVVIILTEAIALSAFSYRFLLDRQLIDLKDSIKQKEAIVSLSKTNEDKFRNLQGRLKLMAELKDSAAHTTHTLTGILNKAPADLIFKNVILTENTIKIDADVQSVSSLATFTKALRNHPDIVTVSLDEVENKTTNATIAVSITAFLKQNENVKMIK